MFSYIIFLMLFGQLFQIISMYNNVGAQPKAQQLPFPPQASSFGDAFTGVGSGLISGGLSAYGERIFGSSSQYVQSNVSSNVRRLHC